MAAFSAFLKSSFMLASWSSVLASWNFVLAAWSSVLASWSPRPLLHMSASVHALQEGQRSLTIMLRPSAQVTLGRMSHGTFCNWSHMYCRLASQLVYLVGSSPASHWVN